MRICVITYTDENFKRSASLNRFTAKVIGRADQAAVYGPESIDENFFSRNREILSQKRGAGYWLWKPYIIKKTLEQADEGDYILYLDAGAFCVRPIRTLIMAAQRENADVFLSSSLYPNGHWCKRDAFIAADCDAAPCFTAHQIEATFLLLRNGQRARDFVNLWLDFASDDRINTDLPNRLGKDNCIGFRENRHDQTALNLAAFKSGIKAYKGFSDSSEFGAYVLAKKNWGCWGYSEEELKRFAYEEYCSYGYTHADYNRVIINCRARDQHFVPFCKSVYRAVRDAIIVDLRRNRDYREIMTEFEKR